jgi:nitrogenase molybdenum-iron protein alpha/beta subunit
MIDGHKYNGEARAAIYGEPDFVYSTVRLCLENGIMPLITATGTKCAKLKELLSGEIEELAGRYYIDRFEILDEIDFQSIEQYAKNCGKSSDRNSDGDGLQKIGDQRVRRGSRF